MVLFSVLESPGLSRVEYVAGYQKSKLFRILDFNSLKAVSSPLPPHGELR